MADMDEAEEGSSKGVLKGRGKKVNLKRVKKKNLNLNISKGNLQSVHNNKRFNFLNMSIQKQTLRANNKALAQNLSKTRQQLQEMNTYTHQLRSEIQELKLERNKLRAVVGIKDDEIEDEVRRRIELTMKEMKVVCEDLGNSMFQSSQHLQNLFVRFDQYCGSNNNSRGSSLGCGDNNGDTVRPAPITTTTTARRNVFSSVADISSKQGSGEMTGGVSMSRFTPTAADMTIIAETSVLEADDDINSCPRTALEPVTEGIVSQKKITVSRFPQRIPKPDNKLDTTNNLTKTNSTKIPVSSAFRKSLEGNKDDSDKVKEPPKENKDNEPARSKDKNKKGKKDTKADSSSDKEVRFKDKNTKRTTGNKTDGKSNKSTDVNKADKQIEQTAKDTPDDNPTPEPDLDLLEEDLTSFGFSELLVSGSPIIAESKESERVTTKSNADDNKKLPDKQAVKAKPDKVIVKSKSESNLKPVDKSKPSEKSKSGDKLNIDNKPKPDYKKVSKSTFKAPQAVEKKDPKKTVSDRKALKKKGRQTYVSENPFKPKTCPIPRSPIENQSAVASLEGYNEVNNPFKPTKTLLRSPVHGERKSDEDKSILDKIDSHTFLSKFKDNLDRLSQESAPLPEPSFQDEPTTYFNTDMEFTAVIDTASFLKTMAANSKSPAKSDMGTGVEKSTAKESSQKVKGSENKARTKDRKDKAIADKDKQDKMPDEQNDEGAAVEVRTMKPGVFTFSVSRKDADGTRKPVPEPVSKARSKKKVVSQIDEEPRKTGADRDMFNFGDRTPTMPLEKMPKSASHDPYELSMTEGPATQNSIKERLGKPTKLPDVLSGGASYTVPMKSGSPDEKHEKTKSSRSKSKTRSKSRSRDSSDSDDDYEPGKARSKSRVRSRGRSVRKANGDSNTEEKVPTRSKSRGRAAETEVEAANEIETRTRGRSRPRKSYVELDSDEELEAQSEPEIVEPNALSSRKSRTMTRKTEGVEDEVNAEEQTAKMRSRSRQRSQTDTEKVDRDGRSRTRSRSCVRAKCEESGDVSKEPEVKEEDSDKQCHKEVKERSRSKKKVARDDEDGDFVAFARCGRSRSRIRTLKKDDENDDEADQEKNNRTELVEDHNVNGGKAQRKTVRNVNKTTAVDNDDNAIEQKKDIRKDDLAGTEELDDDNDDFEERLKVKRKSRVNKRKKIVIESDDEDKNDKSKSPEPVKKLEKSEKKLTTKKNKLDPEPSLIPETDYDAYQAKPIRRKSTKLLSKTFSTEKEEKSEKGGIKSDNDDIENGKITKDNKAKDDKNEIDDVQDISNDRMKVLDKHVTTNRGGSSRHKIKDISNEEEGKENIDNDDVDNDNVDIDNDNVGDKIDEEKHNDTESKGRGDRKAKLAKTGSKSTRKGIEGRQKDRKREKSVKSKIFQDDGEEESSDSLPEKTPAIVGVIKGAKSAKTTCRAAQKRRAVDVSNNDVTPKVKKDNTGEAKQNTEKSGNEMLAALKRRLTMINARKQSTTDLPTASHDAGKDETTTDDREDDDGDGERQRRSKVPVSYKPLPLNVKLRQGDKLFVPSQNSAKAKAEQMRLAICRKTSVSKIGLDDQENIAVE